MFIKISKAKGYEYVLLVESYRDNGKPKHRIIANLGRKEILEHSGLESVISGLQRVLKKDKQPKENNKKDITTLKEINRFNYGYLVYQKLWYLHRLPNLFKEICQTSKIQYDLEQVAFLIIINQLLSPSSKLCLFSKQDHYFRSCEDIPLHIFYRALDKLAESKEIIEEYLFEINRNLFNLEVDVIFYDVTTYHFESQHSDELRDFGFSKAGKFNEVQIVMGLLIDKEGHPVGYELFSGNTSDSKTMVTIMKNLQKRFQIDKLVIVADNGLNSKANLKYIKDSGFDYIVRSSIKKMKSSIQEEVLNISGYIEISNIEDEEQLKIKELPYNNTVTYEMDGKKKRIELQERLICTWSSKRARKDQHDRQRAVDKAMKLIESNNRSALSPHGYKKYIQTPSSSAANKEMSLDEAKLANETRFDGFAAIQCSDQNLSIQEIIENYHHLFKIEESFRIMKSTFETRPVFVWNKKRIEGHFVCCFLAFLLERRLESKLKNNGIAFSSRQIQEELNRTELSEIEIEDEKYFMRGKSSALSKKIFRILRIKQPKQIQDVETIENYIGKI
ncbi:MAG TPA: IS1634 family transposase [Candidatus Cloacimonetes bacterium]|nr:IS1634 family transposase [Candidatus Cloacimonadota bacterium]